MKLNEYLTDTNNHGKSIHLGTQDGGGFIFVGTVGASTATKVVRDLNKQAKLTARGRLDSLQSSLSSTRRPVHTNPDEKIATYELRVKKYKDRVAQFEKYIEKWRDYLKHFESFGLREIVDISASNCWYNTDIVIVEGIETGDQELPALDSNDLSVDGCINLLEAVYQLASEEYENAYREVLRTQNRAGHRDAVIHLNQASDFFRNNPLVTFSGTDGANAMRTIESHVKNDYKTRVMLRKLEAIDRAKAKKQNRVSELIKETIAKRGEPLKEIGEKTGIAPSTIGCYRNGKTPKVPNKSLETLCKYLDIWDKVSAYYGSRK